MKLINVRVKICDCVNSRPGNAKDWDLIRDLTPWSRVWDHVGRRVWDQLWDRIWDGEPR